MQATSDFGDHSTVDNSFYRDIDMNGIPQIGSSGAGGFDACGYDETMAYSIDTRNSKF